MYVLRRLIRVVIPSLSRDVYGLDDGDFLGIGLSSRKNLCIHPSVGYAALRRIVS